MARFFWADGFMEDGTFRSEFLTDRPAPNLEVQPKGITHFPTQFFFILLNFSLSNYLVLTSSLLRHFSFQNFHFGAFFIFLYPLFFYILFFCPLYSIFTFLLSPLHSSSSCKFYPFIFLSTSSFFAFPYLFSKPIPFLSLFVFKNTETSTINYAYIWSNSS